MDLTNLENALNNGNFSKAYRQLIIMVGCFIKHSQAIVYEILK
ncbi:hypothetical protein VN0596_14770 [Helicobacter pylori]